MKISKKAFGYIRDFVRILLVILIFSTISIFWHLNQLRDFYAQYVNEANELSLLIREVPKYVGDAFVGPDRENAFKNLDLTVLNIDSEFNVLFNGRRVNEKEVLPPTNYKIKFSELSEFFNAWMVIKPKINLVVNNKTLILNLTQLNAGLITHIKNIQDIYWTVLDGFGQSKPDNASKIIAISKQINLMENLINEIQSILTVADSSSRLLKQFSADAESFLGESLLINAMIKNNISAEKAIEVDKTIDQIKLDIAAVVKAGAVTEEINKAIFDIFNQSPLLINLSSNLKNAYINYPKTNVSLELYAYGLGFLSFLVLILSMQIFYKENEENLKTIEEKNKLMQIEVEKLLKELPNIASGESSLDALVSLNIASHPTQLPESFTYALSTLRRLVFNIGKTSKNVSSAAEDAQKITQTVSRSSQDQAQEISEVTDSVKTLATTIEQVSSNAAESANVALESVNIAGEGGRVVRDTIQGMQRIQTKIEETANLMRGLSDRSQEIGEIVSLIDGIAEQTNILSLNASIQAAMAGDAGRGFAVVADEVQRLAEKVSYATKEISTLVHAIQNDTTEVIVAMDHTKTEALKGVKSAQSAGATLEQIETVSRRLSDLIQAISLSAREEAAVSGKISQMMNDIKSIAQETATGSLSTVQLIEKLSQFVDDLRNSVLALKLPSDITSK